MTEKPVRRNTIEAARSEMDEALMKLDELRTDATNAEDAYKQQAKFVLGLMGDAERAEVEYPTGVKFWVTRSQNRPMKLNEAMLKMKLGAKKFKDLLTPQFDEGKLQTAVKSGEVDPVVVASCMEEKPSEWFLKYFKR